MTIIIFIIVLAVLIFVHELGHFLAARACGIRVDAFKIGFGPKVFAWKRGDTEYGLNLIPFGGFVKIFGEDPDAASVSGPDAGRSFVNKPRWQQAICLAAGVLGNFIFAWILYSIVFAAGVNVDADQFSAYASRFTDRQILISDIISGSPAEMAGLQAGDRLLYVETTAMNQARAGATPDTAPAPAPSGQTIQQIQDDIDSYGGKPVALAYERDGQTRVIAVTPVVGLVPGKYAIGIGMSDAAHLALPPGEAVIEGARFTGLLVEDTVVGVYSLVADAIHGTPDFSQVTGPVGLYGIIGDAARMGWTYVVMITAIISVNLGVINLVPFPALDGGRILFVVIEAVGRRRIPAKVANSVNIAGFALLMILMVAITWHDVAKLVHG